ncbi:MAG: TIGR01777 family protein [Gemmatimonadetes bacterium]|nr:TIGR01777 family protein [Gemmatimonadota bacterium]
MRVFITGGTGFIGRAVVEALTARGDQCVVLSRGGASVWPTLAVRMIQGDSAAGGPWQDDVGSCDAVINLAGEKIVDPPKRWTRGRKKLLWDSRVFTTGHVTAAIRRASTKPRVLLSGSAIGYYGNRGDDVVDESRPAGSDFLAKLATAWEHAALEAQDITRVTLLRTGIVLGAGGGALEPLLRLFRLGLGGPWGDGLQWWSWIHRADAVALMLFALDQGLPGPLNVTAPAPVTVNDFAAALGKAVHRPAVFRAPRFALELGLGEGASALLDLQRVVPKRALTEGFRFQYPEVPGALREIVGA